MENEEMAPDVPGMPATQELPQPDELCVSKQESEEEMAGNPENSDVIYELSEPSEPSANSDSPDNTETPEASGNLDDAESTESAKAEIKRMIEDMGADTLLDIIKGNRNAAIRQIIKEVEASRPPLQSGVSAARSCNSIFDLAALA